MTETGPKSEDDKILNPENQPIEALDEIPKELNEEELDSLLQKEDPDFLKSVGEIGDDKTLFVKDIVLSSEEQELAEEVELWEKSKGLKGRLYKVLPGMAKLSLKLKKWKFKLFLRARAQWVSFKNFTYFLATTGKSNLIHAIRERVQYFKDGLGARIDLFKKFSKLKKAFAFLLLAAALGTGFFIYRSLTHGVIPVGDQLFISSMESLASSVYDYEPMTESEPFYDNLRVTQNLLLLPKVVVNLKPSAEHKLPMAAFEFFIEGIIPEVIVEVKDREAAIKDTLQRAIEEFTFESLESGEGKKELCERLKKEINLLLTTGAIKKVLIKTVVLKP